MSLLRINSGRILSGSVKKRCFAYFAAREEEYTATPQYPPIEDLSPKKKLERKKAAQHEVIKAVKTVEEKQIKLNMPKYYGFKCYMLREDYIPYNNLEMVQSVTRTHLIESTKIPEFYNKIEIDHSLSLKSDLEELISLELESFKRIYDLKQDDIDNVTRENIISNVLCKGINRLLLCNLSAKYSHLRNMQVDLNSRIESVWYAGGMKPPERVKKYREGLEWLKDSKDEPVDRIMNYTGSANVALRTDKPLLPIIPYSEAENSDFDVPHFQYDPRVVGTATEHRHIANVPGFWPGDPNRFGQLSYHCRGHMLTRHYNDPEDDKEALHRKGILSSFGWLNAQANFLGFTTFNDITYPLVTQTIITNGKLWSFYIYQLNTILNHSKYVHENPKRNVCWATPELKLFDDVQNGKIINFNVEVLEILMKLYANAPENRLGVNLTPYLSQEVKLSADYEDDEKTTWLEREYKHLVSNRPRAHLEYEIYAWEKIYKIDHETRFMEKKRRPFELKVKPTDRTLDDRKPRYIPRAHRPELPRHKGRNAKEFFP